MAFAFNYQNTSENPPPEQPRPRQQQGSSVIFFFSNSVNHVDLFQCEACRRKKLRCDRGQPSCGACVTAGVACVTRSNCPPRGPKKGHLKELRNQICGLLIQRQHLLVLIKCHPSGIGNTVKRARARKIRPTTKVAEKNKFYPQRGRNQRGTPSSYTGLTRADPCSFPSVH